MFAGMALSVRLLVYAGLSLFIISGPNLYMVVCVLYAYNLTISNIKERCNTIHRRFRSTFESKRFSHSSWMLQAAFYSWRQPFNY